MYTYLQMCIYVCMEVYMDEKNLRYPIYFISDITHNISVFVTNTDLSFKAHDSMIQISSWKMTKQAIRTSTYFSENFVLNKNKT